MGPRICYKRYGKLKIATRAQYATPNIYVSAGKQRAKALGQESVNGLDAQTNLRANICARHLHNASGPASVACLWVYVLLQCQKLQHTSY